MTPAPIVVEIHRYNFNHSVREKDMKDHIFQNVCSKFGEHILTSWTISSEWSNLDHVPERLYVGRILHQ